ncbi:MAG: DNA-3-methyladenine glycosylase I [Candidatus Iainarchaeum archaeon]|uniref:DNA-3-methyladenine glycosylase I n=1 Tax=Candidatus Iainarchaeum sp. TaxID=3101447 RepID=A0A7T9DJD8_9ARCH|nr:MAG: DNA-3-methyladenine glycosylase I [Candidatus Diapherotrites archaeon]
MKQRVYKAKTDSGLLDQISFIVFVIRFNYRLVEKKWPQIQKAFYQFDVKKLAKMDENDLDSFMQAEGMIKNKFKMRAVLQNAKIIQQKQKQFGSALKWIEHCKKESQNSPILAKQLNECFQEFQGIGKMTSGWLESLYSSKKDFVEYEMPD